jgi:predicted transcriptional regulator
MAKTSKRDIKTTTKKTKIVGEKKFLDQETGEIVNMNVIEMQNTDFNFEKIWIAHILDSLELIGNKKIKVVNYLLKEKNSKNLVITTQRNMAEKLEISKTTVSKTIIALQESDFISQVQNGVYRVNPNVIFKGSKSNRMKVLLDYQKEADENENT